MFTCTIENAFGTRVQLTNDETNYQILSIGGLNPPKVQLNHSTVAVLDGSRFNSARLNERNIVILLKLNGDVESNRLNMYQLFALKHECKFYYKNEHRNVYIAGRVESIECDYFTNKETMQISMICPFPYFKDIDIIVDDISKVIKKFEFPFSIEYDEPEIFSEIEVDKITDIFNMGESECGIIINIDFIGSVNQMKIINTGNGETFTVNHGFISGDNLVINTNKGEKSVVLTRNGAEINLFAKVARGSTFFNLNRGDNYFSYEADNGDHDQNVSIVYKHYTIYGGV